MRTRPTLIFALLGLAASGATCRGGKEKIEDRPLGLADLGQKAPAITELEGVDLSGVDPARRSELLRLLNETYSYCGCPRSLASCLAKRADCTCVPSSERMTDFILREMRLGAAAEDVEAQLLGGFSEGYNGRAATFTLEQQASKGPADAKHTIVEFADFRCPHCAAAFPVLEELLAKRPDVRLVYFYYPLGGGGDRSVRAAEAAEEARVQGRFWEMAALLFDNQTAVEDEDLERYAERVGLDLSRFREAMKAGTHREKVNANKRVGESVQVRSTPSFFIDGRPFGLARTVENLEMRLAMEKERAKCE